MTVGIVMLAHTALPRAAQVARHWHAAGCPVVIHVDKRVAEDDYRPFVDSLSDLENLRFTRRLRCDWGTWSLGEAVWRSASIGCPAVLCSLARVQHLVCSKAQSGLRARG